MSAFLVAAIGMLGAMIPGAVTVARGGVPDAVVAFQAITADIVMVLALIAEGFNRSGEFELPLLGAVLLYGSGLVFVRFMERGL